jgi:hypothetical protein
MLVFDTSAFINGWRVHYPPETFPSVWQIIADAIADGRIVAPREVYAELKEKDDEVFAWAKKRRSKFVDPTEEVQREVGPIMAMLPKPGVRDRADPFVIAEAKVRKFTVVTYEGTNTLTGKPTAAADKKMPGICKRCGVECCIVPAGLKLLGVTI